MIPNWMRRTTFGGAALSALIWTMTGQGPAISRGPYPQSGPYYDIVTLPTGGQAGGLSSGTEAYYCFDYGNLHFI